MEKICVLMTSYNPRKFFIDQVKSVLNQVDVDVKIIIRDDCSKDKTWLREVPDDSRIEIIEGEENLGVAHNILKLIRYAKQNMTDYKYFAYCDQDDVWRPEKLKTGILHLSNMDSSKPCLYYSNLTVVNEELKNPFSLFKHGVVKNTLGQSVSQIFLFACTSIFNQKMVDEILRQPIEFMAFDHLIYYIGIIKGDIYYDDNSYIYYRQHGDNVSGVKNKGIKYLLSKKSILKKDENNDYARAGGGSFRSIANYLLKYFENDLSAEQCELLNKVASYKSLLSRISIIIDKRIRAGYQPKDLYRTLRLLLGKY